MRIGIVGAGIGGLAAAIALSRDGHDVELLEQTARFEPVGAGIVLGPNAVAVLNAFGVDTDGLGVPLDRMEILRWNGRPLSSIPIKPIGAAHGVPRPELHARLVAALGLPSHYVAADTSVGSSAVGSSASPSDTASSTSGSGRSTTPTRVRLRMDTRVVGVRASEREVVVRTESGDCAYELLVGADGLHSLVREQVHGAMRLRYSGQTCWRWIAPYELGPRAIEWWSSKRRIGAVPVGPGQAYFYAVATATQGDPGPESLAHWRSLFDGIPAAAEAVATAPDVPTLHHDLFELHRSVWGEGRIVLLGDAAHAMTPNLGQGAAMGIEDAAALALTLRPPGPIGTANVENGDPEALAAALAAYAAVRRQRVRIVRRLSRHVGSISHMPPGLFRRARDFSYSGMPSAMLRAQFRALMSPGLHLAEAYEDRSGTTWYPKTAQRGGGLRTGPMRIIRP